MENTKRLDYIDYTKGFGILLVILGHIYDTSNPIKIWLYSFHMPLFFIISGFFAKNIKFKVLFKKIFDNKEIESLRFFGRNTLIIMFTQQLIINYINKFTGVDYYNTLYGIVTFLVVILIEIPIIYVIKNYLSFMIGKFPKKKNAQTITG